MKSLLWVSILLSRLTFAQFEVIPIEQSKAVKPGEVSEAQILTRDEALIVDYTPKAIQLLGDYDSFYLFSLGPWLKNNDGWEIQGKIVFGKNFSPDREYTYSNDLGSVQFKFKGWLWNPTPEAIAKEFSYENLELLSRSWWIKNWPLSIIIIAILLLAISRLAYSLIRKRKKRLTEKNIKNLLRAEIINAQSIHDYALLWLKRDEIKNIFSAHEVSLRGFFDELNRYQFKPHVSDLELSKLGIAKSKLISALSEEKHGI